MRTLTILFSCLIGLGITAQNQRYIYEYKLIKDSTNRAEQRIETMYLDTSKEGSNFYSYTAYHGDSLVKADLEKQLKATGIINIKDGMRKGAERYSVSKIYPSFKMYLHNRIGRDAYKIIDDRTVSWKISAEKEKVGQWDTQKATANFAGREWTAWFTNDIPLQDGPYKFSGLPGLIVKLEDKTKSHVFEMKGIKKLSPQEFDAVTKPKNEISINLQQYQKLIEEYEKDPTKGLKQVVAGGIVMMQSGGDKQWLRERETKMKEELRKDNNKIELSFK